MDSNESKVKKTFPLTISSRAIKNNMPVYQRKFGSVKSVCRYLPEYLDYPKRYVTFVGAKRAKFIDIQTITRPKCSYFD